MDELKELRNNIRASCLDIEDNREIPSESSVQRVSWAASRDLSAGRGASRWNASLENLMVKLFRNGGMSTS